MSFFCTNQYERVSNEFVVCLFEIEMLKLHRRDHMIVGLEFCQKIGVVFSMINGHAILTMS